MSFDQYAAVKVIGETWTCRCCGNKFPSNEKFEEHLSIK